MDSLIFETGNTDQGKYIDIGHRQIQALDDYTLLFCYVRYA